MGDDQPVTGIREEPQVTARQRGGQPLGLRWWDGGILLTLENPDVRSDLHQGEAPRPPFDNSIPGVRIDPLLDRFTDGVEVKAPGCLIFKQSHVRFWPG